MKDLPKNPASKALQLLDLHHEAFFAAEPYAVATGHPVPSDTRGWSQILVSVLTDVSGLKRQKGADLEDGSDVKGANTWNAIDTPRFNGVIKAGTKASTSNRIQSLNAMPHLYLVLWDETERDTVRCRVWVVRPQKDGIFRKMCSKWYKKRANGEITSNNFQLHPPRKLDTDIIRNTCGNLEYPLFFAAEKTKDGKYKLTTYTPELRKTGLCKKSK